MTQIKKLKNSQGVQVYPQTHTKAVIDDNGYTAESRLGAMQDEINNLQEGVVVVGEGMTPVPSDLTPTENSRNWVTSGGVYNAIQVVQSDVTELGGILIGTTNTETGNSNFVQGTIGNNGVVDSNSTTRCVTPNLILLPAGATLSAKNNGQYHDVALFNASQVWESTTGWVTSDAEYVYDADKYVRLAVRKTNNGTITPSEITVKYVISKQSEGLITQVGNNTSSINALNDAVFLEGEINISLSALESKSGYINQTSEKWVVDTGNTHKLANVQEYRGKVMKVQANSTSSAILYFLKSYTTPVNNASMAGDMCSGETGEHLVTYGTSSEFTIPSDCIYVYFGITNAGTDRTPSNVTITTTVNILDELENDVAAIKESLSFTKATVIDKTYFQQGTDGGGYIDTSSSASNKRCITTNMIPVKNGTVLTVVNNGMQHGIPQFDSDGNYTGTNAWQSTDQTYTFTEDGYIWIILKIDNSTVITPDDITATITLYEEKDRLQELEDEINSQSESLGTKANDSFIRFNKKYAVYNSYKDHPQNQYKGQLHCHTNNSDAQATMTPSAVVATLVAAGFDFMTITDHNYITPNPITNEDIVWMGNAYEDTHNTAGYQHMNVFNCDACYGLLSPVSGETYITPDGYSMLQTSNTPSTLVEHFVKNGNSVVCYNHPEYSTTYASDATLNTLPDGISFIEIYNYSVKVGRGDTTGNLDRGFRIMLDKGHKVFCLAVSDGHGAVSNYNFPYTDAYQMVFANSRTKNSIWQGLLSGASYASTGVALSDITFVDGVFSLNITDGASAVTTFYGKNNTVLATVNGATPSYEATGAETYIRAMVVLDSAKAWTQPIWILGESNQYDF